MPPRRCSNGSFRAAWVLGKSASERKSIYSQAKTLYDLRSKIVHGTKVKHSSGELLRKAGEMETLARKLIHAELNSYKVTGTGIKWPEIVFGS